MLVVVAEELILLLIIMMVIYNHVLSSRHMACPSTPQFQKRGAHDNYQTRGTLGRCLVYLPLNTALVV